LVDKKPQSSVAPSWLKPAWLCPTNPHGSDEKNGMDLVDDAIVGRRICQVYEEREGGLSFLRQSDNKVDEDDNQLISAPWWMPCSLPWFLPLENQVANSKLSLPARRYVARPLSPTPIKSTLQVAGAVQQ
jgi:hypothetical protein